MISHDQDSDYDAKTSSQNPSKKPLPHLVFLSPLKNEELPAHPRIHWYSLTPLSHEWSVELIIRDKNSNKIRSYKLDTTDFLILDPLADGYYRFQLIARKKENLSCPSKTVSMLKSKAQLAFVKSIKATTRDRILCQAAWTRIILSRSRSNPCCRLREAYGIECDLSQSAMDAANAPGMLILRESLLRGDERYCTPTCKKLKKRATTPEEARIWFAQILKNIGIEEGSDEFNRRLTAFMHGHLQIEGPLLVKVMLGSKCNHKCIFCPLGSSSYSSHWKQGDAVFQYLADNLKSIRWLTLTGGEPLALISEISERFRALFDKESQLKVLTFQTNGSLIDRQIDLLVNVPCLELRVSMAGGDASSYYATHRKNDFHKVVSNLEKLRSIRNAAGNSTSIILKMAYTKTNFRSLPGLFDIASKIGARRILYHHVMVLKEADMAPSEQPRETDPEWPQLLAIAEWGDQEAKSRGIQFDFRTISDKRIRVGNQYDIDDTEDEDS